METQGTISASVLASKAPSILDATVLAALPQNGERGLLERVATTARSDWQKVIVVDDGVAASQNVPGSAVVNSWSPSEIEWLLQQPGDVGYVLTGCRYRGFDDAAAIGSLVGRALRDGAQRKSMELTIVSCAEAVDLDDMPIDASSLIEGLGADVHGVVMVSCDPVHGAVTYNGTHYQSNGDVFVASPRKQIAHDFVLNSEVAALLEWEPEIDLTRQDSVPETSMNIETLRTRGSDHLGAFLVGQLRGTTCVIDAVDQHDLAIIAAGVRKAAQLGANWVVRSTGAAVPALAGMELPQTQAPDALIEDRGGMVIVGADAPLSAQARADLFAMPSIKLIEASAQRLTEVQTARDELLELTREASAVVRSGVTAIVYVAADAGGAAPATERVRNQVALRLARTLLGVSDQPSYAVVQGPHTSNVLMADTINARRTAVGHPIVDGVAVWELGGASSYRGMPLVAMPNGVSTVARDQMLVDVVTRFEENRS